MVGKFIIYQDKSKTKEWRWKFESSGNWKIIADSGEGYESKAGCENGIKVLKKEISDATIEYV
jgi:uncharacterized protein YegP (UPF0339 family)